VANLSLEEIMHSKNFGGLKREWIGAAAFILTLAAGLLAMGSLAQDRVLYPVKTGAQDKPAAPGKPVVSDWRVLEGVSYENLTVFPVVSRMEANTSAFTTLDEGLVSGDVVVAESGSDIIRRSRDGRPIRYNSGPQVNQLVLVNRGKRPLLLLAGEVVSGGKQDRVIAKDRIVPPGADPLPLDVFCVEHGRWTGASDNFNASKFMVHPSVREKAAVDNDQSQVWAAVRNGSTSASAGAVGGVGAATATPAAPPALSRQALETVVVESGTQSYDKIYNKSRVGQSVDTFAAEVSRRFEKSITGLKGERVIGVVIAYGGEVAWSDAFASESLFRAYWPKLLKSYIVEALARPRYSERATLDDAREFLEPLRGRVNEESEPGVYRWRQTSQGRLAAIELESLAPRDLLLHWVKIQKTS
jgi:ARG/rhodanese/phosphatase superfamily protein